MENWATRRPATCNTAVARWQLAAPVQPPTPAISPARLPATGVGQCRRRPCDRLPDLRHRIGPRLAATPVRVPPPRAFPVRQLSAAGLWLSFSGPYVVRVVLIDGGCLAISAMRSLRMVLRPPQDRRHLDRLPCSWSWASPRQRASPAGKPTMASRIDGAPARSPGSDLAGSDATDRRKEARTSSIAANCGSPATRASTLSFSGQLPDRPDGALGIGCLDHDARSGGPRQRREGDPHTAGRARTLRVYRCRANQPSTLPLTPAEIEFVTHSRTSRRGSGRVVNSVRQASSVRTISC